MIIVVPAAGHSTRFNDGDPTPKQFRLFPWHGNQPRMMWENAIHGIDDMGRVYVGVRSDHAATFMGHGDDRVVTMKASSGQADTLVRVLDSVDARDEVVVVNCDGGFSPGALVDLVRLGQTWSMPAAITMRVDIETCVNRWSYVDANPLFHVAHERLQVSPFVLVGAYYFPSGLALRDALHVVVSGTIGEPYLSSVYGLLSGSKLSVPIYRADWSDWGTSEAFHSVIRY